MIQASIQYVENMTPAQQRALEVKLRPGQDSMTGFLAEDERLSDCAASKAQVLRDHGVTFDALADRIETLKAQEDRNVYAKQFGVDVSRYRGFQTCPFSSCGELSSTDLHVTQIATGKKLTIPGLMPHLVRDHHFLEGRVPYGLDPKEAIEVLEMNKPLVPDVEATTQASTQAAADTKGFGVYRV